MTFLSPRTTTDTLLGFSKLDSLPPKAEATNISLVRTLDLYRGVAVRVDGLALNIHLAFSELRSKITEKHLRSTLVYYS